MLQAILATTRNALGYRAVQRGKSHKAIRHFSDAIRRAPTFTAAFVNRGVSYQQIGEHRLARVDFEQAIALDPTLSMAYYNRGISAKFLGDYESAIADHVKAISLNPRFANAYGELGVVYACKHEYDLAIASLSKAIKLDPNEPILSRERGYAQFHRGNFAASADDLRRSLDLSTNVYAAIFCFLARSRSGAPAEEQLRADTLKTKSTNWPMAAASLFLGACSPETLLTSLTEPDERAEAQFYIGQWHLLRGNRMEAIAALQLAVEQCPTVFTEHTGAVAELGRLARAE
jgi:lipoprotein NlpI